MYCNIKILSITIWSLGFALFTKFFLILSLQEQFPIFSYSFKVHPPIFSPLINLEFIFCMIYNMDFL